MSTKWMYQVPRRNLSVTQYYAQSVVSSAIAAGIASSSATFAGTKVTIAAGTDGLTSGTVQSKIQDLTTRVKALEDA